MMLKATFTLNDSVVPHEVDYVNLEGSHARKPQAGIFEWRAGELKICMAPPGNVFIGFLLNRRNGRSLTTWRLLAK